MRKLQFLFLTIITTLISSSLWADQATQNVCSDHPILKYVQALVNSIDDIEVKTVAGVNTGKPVLPIDFKSNSHRHCKNSKSKPSCNTAIPITSKDINRNGGGFVITSPGEYCLKTDVIFKPREQGLAAIVINLPSGICNSHVVLDLNDKILSQCDSTPNTFGILINGQTNVTVRGGKIKSFTGNGIRVNSGSDQLLFDRLQIVGCGSPLLETLSSGILIFNSTEIQVLNSTFRENINIGLGCAGVNDLLVDHCAFEDCLEGTTPFFGPGTTAVGMVVVGSTFIPEATFSPINIIIKNSYARRIRATNLTSGIVVANFFPPPVSNVLIERCTVTDLVSEGNLVPVAESEGIGVFAKNAIIKDCYVSSISNLVNNSEDVHGIEVSGSDIVVENCVVSNIVATSDPLVGFASGFNVENVLPLFSGTLSENITYKNCIASNIVNLSSDNAFGFAAQTFVIGLPTPSIGYTYDSCVAEGVFGSGGTRAAGFFLTGQQQLTVKNCISKNNNIGFNFEDITGGALSSNGVIQDNIAESNDVYGFRDVTGADNAYTSNFAITNGSPGDNYFGPIFPPSTCPPTPGTPGTPMRLWILPGAPCNANNNGVIGDKLDNLDVR